MHWRRFKVSAIPLGDLQTFDLWLRDRWAEKDALMEHYMQKGRFPADIGSDNLGEGGKRRQGAGHIETKVKPNNWYEILQVFAPIASIAIVLYYFYNKTLPANIFDTATDWAGFNEEDIKKLLRVGPAPKLGKPKTASSQALKNTLKPPNLHKNEGLATGTPRTFPGSPKSSLNGSAVHTKPASTRAASMSGMSVKGAPSVVSNANSMKSAATQKPAKFPTFTKPASTRAASVSGPSAKDVPSIKLSATNAPKIATPQKPAGLQSSATPQKTASLQSTATPQKVKTPQKVATTQKPAQKPSSVNLVNGKEATEGVPKQKAPVKDKTAKTAPAKSSQAPNTSVNKDPNKELSTKKAVSKDVPSKDLPSKKSSIQNPPTKESQSKDVSAAKPKPKPKPKPNSETPKAGKKNVPLKKTQTQTTPHPPLKTTGSVSKPLAQKSDSQKPPTNTVATKPVSISNPTPKLPAKQQAIQKNPATPKTEIGGPSVQSKQVAWSETTAVDDPWSERPSGKRLVKAQPTRKDRVKVAKKMQRQHLDHVAA